MDCTFDGSIQLSGHHLTIAPGSPCERVGLGQCRDRARPLRRADRGRAPDGVVAGGRQRDGDREEVRPSRTAPSSADRSTPSGPAPPRGSRSIGRRRRSWTPLDAVTASQPTRQARALLGRQVGAHLQRPAIRGRLAQRDVQPLQLVAARDQQRRPSGRDDTPPAARRDRRAARGSRRSRGSRRRDSRRRRGPACRAGRCRRAAAAPRSSSSRRANRRVSAGAAATGGNCRPNQSSAGP